MACIFGTTHKLRFTVILFTSCLYLAQGGQSISGIGNVKADGSQSPPAMGTFTQHYRLSTFEHRRVTLGRDHLRNAARFLRVFEDSLEKFRHTLTSFSDLLGGIAAEQQLAHEYLQLVHRKSLKNANFLCGWRRIGPSQLVWIMKNDFQNYREQLLARIYSAMLSLIMVSDCESHLNNTPSDEYSSLVRDQLKSLDALVTSINAEHRVKLLEDMSAYERLAIRSLEHAAIIFANRSCNRLLTHMLENSRTSDCRKVIVEYGSRESFSDLSWIKDASLHLPPLSQMIYIGADYTKVQEGKPDPFYGDTSRLLRIASMTSELQGDGNYELCLEAAIDNEAPPEKRELALYLIREHYLPHTGDKVDVLKRVAGRLDGEENALQRRLLIYLGQIIWMAEHPDQEFEFRYIEDHLPPPPDFPEVSTPR